LPLSDKLGLVLVTGANGFVGSHLVEALLERGYRVRCLVRRTSDLTFIRELPVEWAYADVRDADNLRQACLGVDAVCHCAGVTRALDEETYMRVNAQAVEVMARACIEANPHLQRFLFVSSLAAVGPSQDGDHFLDEFCRAQPISWYGKSKLAAEWALQGMSSRLPTTIVRPAAVLGPRDRDFLSYFALVKRGLTLQLGREERWASFSYVRDLVRLIVLALESETAVGQTYFGSNQAHTYGELSAAIAKALNKRPVCVTLPEAVLTPMAGWAKVQGRLTGQPALLDDRRMLDLRHRYWLCSGEKARRELGFVAHYDLETGVQETADWYLENGWL
jgi:dihydroflavonol-4-reductase